MKVLIQFLTQDSGSIQILEGGPQPQHFENSVRVRAILQLLKQEPNTMQIKPSIYGGTFIEIDLDGNVFFKYGGWFADCVIPNTSVTVILNEMYTIEDDRALLYGSVMILMDLSPFGTKALRESEKGNTQSFWQWLRACLPF